jgi:adenosine deaminase
MSNIDPILPLVELHRHLDGNVRLETILDISLKNNLPLPARTLDELRPYVQVKEAKPSILDFFTKFSFLTSVMLDYDACRRIAFENVEDARNEGHDYIELRFSPWFMAETHHLHPAGVVEAVVDGIRAGVEKFNLPVGLIGIISRTYGVDVCMQELDALLTQKDSIVALDLAGDETNYPGELFVKHFHKARDAGWHSCPHAGEAAGAESVWQAVHDLGAERIGHAVAAAKDPGLMDYLADHHIGVETSLTSNVQTSTVASYADHPLKKFLQHGIPACINTDDPGISAVDISYEYNYSAVEAGLSEEEIHQTQKNALDCAFISPEFREKLIQSKKKG